MNEKTVLLADIVQSRKTVNRYEVQKKLVIVIDFLNKCYREQLVKKVEISSGDSFQGLFNTPDAAFLYLRIIQMLMYPTKIRAGIGTGQLDYIDDTFSSNLLDGQAYHNARNAISTISNKRAESIRLETTVKNDIQISAINTLFDMYIKLRQIWGSRSLQISLINELINPISLEGTIHYLKNADPIEISLLNEIIFKSYHDSRQNEMKPNALKKQPIINIGELEAFSILDLTKERKYNLGNSSFVLRGVPEDIANIINTTRQNVQKYYSKSIADERKYVSEIVLQLKEIKL